MATKPVVQPEAWATDAVYTTGPYVGQPQKVVPPPTFAAEGHRPGASWPTPAEYENSQQNRITGLVRWVFLGSSAGAADAHIVETNAAGRTAVTGLTVNDGVDETAVSITAAATGGNRALLVTCTAGASTAVQVDIGAASTTAVSTATGAGPFATGYNVSMVGTPGGGAGFRCSADAATGGYTIDVLHAGSGNGARIVHIGSGNGLIVNAASGTGGAVVVSGNSTTQALNVTGGNGQPAIAAVAGTNATAALVALGAGTSYGIDATGGASSGSADAIRGTAVNAGAAGVHGRSASGAGSGCGVQGDGLGAGQIGIFGTATAGYAFLFQGDSTPPLYAIGRFVPQSVDPTASTSTGDWTISLQNQFRYCVSGFGYKPIMSMPTNGSAVLGVANMAYLAVVTVSASGASWNNVLTVTCSASQGNGFASVAGGNTVKVRFTCEVRTTSLAPNTLNLQFLDLTTGGPAFAAWTGTGSGTAAGYYLGFSVLDWQRAVVAESNRTPTLDGDLTIQVQAQSVAGVNLQIRNARLEIIGSY